jgi:hypothetical protein
MLFRETVAVYCKELRKHTVSLGRMHSGTYGNQWGLEFNSYLEDPDN